MDRAGAKYLNNVRVNGILAPNEESLGFLLGVLNGPVADYVFRRLGKPKAGGWFEANKQFIAPLPVPRTSTEEQTEVGRRAVALQRLWTLRRDLSAGADERFAVLPRARHGERWLWPDLPSADALEDEAPVKLRSARDRRAWAEERLAEAIEARRAALQAHLDRAAPLEPAFADGELRLLAGGAVALRGIFLDPEDGALTRAYWRWLLFGARPSDAEAFAKDLRRPPAGASAAAARQFVEKVAELEAAAETIVAQESAMNELLFDLYGLTREERLLVQRG
jgi:hypothetical protein